MKYLGALKKARTWRWIGGILLLIAPIVVWMFQFGNCSISENPEDWGFFGDYIGGVYTVIVTFFAIHLTRYLQNRDVERNKAKTAYTIPDNILFYIEVCICFGGSLLLSVQSV